jgi:hypothetical protein
MHLISDRVRRSLAIALAALALGTCGGSRKESGAGPTVPVELAPTPAPAATATPSAPVSQSCARLPLGAEKYRCSEPGPTFLAEVSDAIDQLQREHPEYFNGDIVTNTGAYYVGVIRNLDRQGICGGFDGEELTVKNTAEFNDQYKIMTSWGQVRKYYIGTCFPAVFPRSSSSPAPSPSGCSLPPSAEIACGRPAAQFLDEMEGAISQVISARPDLFDSSKTAPGTDWPTIKDFAGYHAAVIDLLSKKGYCGKFDGEEIQLKRSNEFTEHYDINFSDQYVRRGQGIFRGACYPAAF